MIRRPPRSTLFPTRRSSDLVRRTTTRRAMRSSPPGPRLLEELLGADRVEDAADAEPRHVASRSEEHTSELQSPCNLVCRLLLEKKNHDDIGHVDVAARGV